MKVAIGPLFDEFGGVSQHILGIKKVSSHDVRLVPSPAVRWAISKTAGLARYGYQKLMTRIRLNGYDVLHSHVDPWFTGLCLLSRTRTCKWVHTYHTLYFEEDYSNGLRSWRKTINRALLGTASIGEVHAGDGFRSSLFVLHPQATLDQRSKAASRFSGGAYGGPGWSLIADAFRIMLLLSLRTC